MTETTTIDTEVAQAPIELTDADLEGINGGYTPTCACPNVACQS